MTYVPDPAGSGNWITEAPDRPPSVATAVKLMYAGAALAVVNVIVSIGRVASLTDALVTRYGYTTGRAHSIAMHDSLLSSVGGLIAAGVWLWMARETAAGRGWTRTLATVLFALFTLGTLLVFRTENLGGMILGLLTWLVALAATICVRRRDALQYFTQSSYRQAMEYPAQPRFF
jgi:NADH:ubiquinone oxidoreductase subunit 2 (subunit N)